MNNFNLSMMEGGKSNAFIYTTFDERFVIKTINQAEKRVFLKMLSRYAERISNQPDSHLIRILGIFKILPQNQHFIIMENIVPSKNIAILFDLKGSLENRRISHVIGTPPGIVLKDKNFLESTMRVSLNETQSNHLIKTLKEDFEFLCSEEVMDYSILIAFYESPPKMKSRYMIETPNRTYSIGVIDILQEYNFSKFSEEKLKKIYKKNSSILSVAEPNTYFNRITCFLQMMVMTNSQFNL